MTRTPPGTAPELSCYTTNLVSYLDTVHPGRRAASRLADAIHLSVRTDLPDGTLAFSHHARIDDNTLTYRGRRDWAGARAAILEELATSGIVIAVGNARHIPWSPHHRQRDVAHWILIHDHGEDGWDISDGFDALLPAGVQHPYHGRLPDTGLRAAMTPLGTQEPQFAHRDTYALGTATPTGSAAHFRWLHHAPAATAPTGDHNADGTWIRERLSVLRTLSDRLTGDDDALDRHADDLWAAARHHCYQAASLAADGRLAPDAADALHTSWSQLPRALRFAADSAARGRRRTGVVARAFDDLIEVTAKAEDHS